MKTRYFTIPNVLTLMNLMCGSAAIVYTLSGHDIKTAFFLILVAAVFDFFDGMSARLLKSYSDLGKQLDSLADVVSFGVAPAIIIFQLATDAGGGVYAFLALITGAFAALRLAKFNIDDSQSDEFSGLPSPACAILLSSLAYIYVEQAYSLSWYWIVVPAVLIAMLMISNIRMFALKFKGFAFSNKDNALRYIFLVAALISLIMFNITAIPFIIVCYIVTSVVKNTVCSKCI